MKKLILLTLIFALPVFAEFPSSFPSANMATMFRTDASGNGRFPSGSISAVGLGSSDTLGFYVNGGHLYVTGDGTDNAIRVGSDSGVQLFSGAGAIRFETDATGIGFFAVTPAARASAYTQTYATADKTHSAPTAAALTVNDGAGTNDGTILAITDNASTIAAVQELADQIGKLVADVADTKQVVNSVIDDLQAYGLMQ